MAPADWSSSSLCVFSNNFCCTVHKMCICTTKLRLWEELTSNYINQRVHLAMPEVPLWAGLNDWSFVGARGNFLGSIKSAAAHEMTGTSSFHKSGLKTFLLDKVYGQCWHRSARSYAVIGSYRRGNSHDAHTSYTYLFLKWFQSQFLALQLPVFVCPWFVGGVEEWSWCWVSNNLQHLPGWTWISFPFVLKHNVLSSSSCHEPHPPNMTGDGANNNN